MPQRSGVRGITLNLRTRAVVSDDDEDGDGEDAKEVAEDGDGNKDADGDGNDAGDADQPAVLQLYGCQALWPDSQHEPGFAVVLAVAGRCLVTHFAHVDATLNGSRRQRQWLLGLPACALEALLTFNSLVVDCESSALVLLETWLRANRDATDAATRRRLCLAVRLPQLSVPYRCVVLPALATDFERAGPDDPAGWFPIDSLEAAAVNAYVAANPSARSYMLALSGGGGAPTDLTESLRVAGRTRREPAPSANWDVSQRALEQALLEESSSSAGDATARLQVTFEGGLECVCAWGFEWRVYLTVRGGYGDGGDGGPPPAVGLQLDCAWPAPLLAPGSRLGSGGGGNSPLTSVAHVKAHVSLTMLGPGQRDMELKVQEYKRIPGTVGSSAPRPLPSRAWGSAAPAPAAGAGSLAAWSDALLAGKLSGTFKVTLDT